MERISHEYSPSKADDDILRLCESLVPGEAPVLVPIMPFAGAQAMQCFENVEQYAHQHGGEQVLGWRLLRWANIMVEGEAHAVWMNPSGELVDVTPYEQQESLFLPDSKMEYHRHAIPNKRIALTESPLVAELISIMNYMDSCRALVEVGEGVEVDYERLSRANAIRSMIHTADAQRNEPCPCGSGLKFKKCCGKYL